MIELMPVALTIGWTSDGWAVELFALAFFLPFVLLWGFSIVSVFLRSDLTSTLKVAWLIVLLILPLVGSLVYLGFSGFDAGSMLQTADEQTR